MGGSKDCVGQPILAAAGFQPALGLGPGFACCGEGRLKGVPKGPPGQDWPPHKFLCALGSRGGN